MKWRWLAVVGLSVLLGGCHERFAVCPFPGAIAPPDPCYYQLDIASVDKKSGEVIGTVAKSVIEANRHRGLFEHGQDYELNEYPFFQYVFHVQDSDLAHLAKLVEDPKTSKDVPFESQPGSSVLKIRSSK